MKDFLKVLKLLVAGLITALFIYPLLHELGHIILCRIFGAKIVEFCIFPSPYTMTYEGKLSGYQMILIGLAGPILPVLVSIIMRPKKFVLWYMNSLIKIISAVSLIIAIISTISFIIGNPVKNEDITSVLSINNQLWIIIIPVSLLLIFILYKSLIKDKPVSKVENYFDIKIIP